jgi:hypothetical protein
MLPSGGFSFAVGGGDVGTAIQIYQALKQNAMLFTFKNSTGLFFIKFRLVSLNVARHAEKNIHLICTAIVSNTRIIVFIQAAEGLGVNKIECSCFQCSTSACETVFAHLLLGNLGAST